MKLSLVIPAYNEAERICAPLERAFAYLEARHPGFEVVVVDDGSTDSTPELVRRRFGERPELRVESYGGNRGKGYAVRYGAARATGDVVLFSDADFSTPIEESEKMLALVDRGFDMVIASRAHEGSEIRERQPFYREGMGKLFNLLVRVFILPGFRDTQCGFKLFRRDRMAAVLPLLRIDGFAFDVEMIAVAQALGLKIAQVPVVWVNSPTSKVRLTRGLVAFLELLPIRRRAREAMNAASARAAGSPRTT